MADTPKNRLRRAYWQQIYAAIATGFGLVSMYYTVTFPTLGIPSMMRDDSIHVSDQQALLIGAIVPGMSLVGSGLAGHWVERFGRRGTVLHGAIIHFIVNMLCFVLYDARLIIFMRAWMGISNSFMVMGGMMYMAEIMNPKDRDRLNSIGAVMMNSGSLLSFWVGTMVEWRQQVCFGALFSIPLILMVYHLRETPIYLLKTGRVEKAIVALTKYRMYRTAAEKEIKQLRDSSKGENADSMSYSKILCTPLYWEPLFIVIVLFACQQTAGSTSISMYAMTIFKDFGSNLDPSYCTVMIGVVNTVTAFFAAEIHARCPRKPTLLSSTMVVLTSLVSLAFYYFLRENGGYCTEWAENNEYIPPVLILIYFAAFGIGLGPMPDIFMSEGLPSNARGKIAGAAMMVNTVVVVIVFMTSQSFITTLGYFGAFLSFAGVTAVMIFFVLAIMPETKGLTLSQVNKRYDTIEIAPRN